MNKLIIMAVLFLSLFSGCIAEREADVVSYNLSESADQFDVNRRVIFYNGITGEYILTIEGLASIETNTSYNRLEVTCKVGPNIYKKHFLGLSDNVTYFVEQLEASSSDPYHYRVTFRPQVIIPDVKIDVK